VDPSILPIWIFLEVLFGRMLGSSGEEARMSDPTRFPGYARAFEFAAQERAPRRTLARLCDAAKTLRDVDAAALVCDALARLPEARA
jgi:hypothetical protein